MNTQATIPFNTGEQVVYPQYGLGSVVQIVTKTVGGIDMSFYRVNFAVQQIEILIPVASAVEKGLRKMMCTEEVDALLETLTTPVHPMPSMQWRRWRKETQRQIKSSNPVELTEVYSHLISTVEEQRKEISFTERKMLSQIEQILYSEIAACKGITCEDALMLMKKQIAISRVKKTHPLGDSAAG